MEFISSNPLLTLGIIAAAVLLVQLCLTLYMGFSLRAQTQENIALNRETYGLMRKIEGLTASRRETIMRHYDKLLENLTARLPGIISAHASEVIFDTESKILARLAELEPNLKNNEAAKAKMDELIQSMEKLDRTIVALTADTVRKIMTESRSELLDDASAEERRLDA